MSDSDRQVNSDKAGKEDAQLRDSVLSKAIDAITEFLNQREKEKQLIINLGAVATALMAIFLFVKSLGKPLLWFLEALSSLGYLDWAIIAVYLLLILSTWRTIQCYPEPRHQASIDEIIERYQHFDSAGIIGGAVFSYTLFLMTLAASAACFMSQLTMQGAAFLPASVFSLVICCQQFRMFSALLYLATLSSEAATLRNKSGIYDDFLKLHKLQAEGMKEFAGTYEKLVCETDRWGDVSAKTTFVAIRGLIDVVRPLVNKPDLADASLVAQFNKLDGFVQEIMVVFDDASSGTSDDTNVDFGPLFK